MEDVGLDSTSKEEKALAESWGLEVGAQAC